MNDKRNGVVGQLVPALIGFLVGAVFGLVVLGWFVWPVEWVNATPNNLDANSRQDYLRAAIDSYMINQDAGLATQRYQVLGEYSDSTLAAIYSNPLNQTTEAVQAYAAAVGATAALQNPPGVPTAAVQVGTPAPETTPGAASTQPGGLLAGMSSLLLPGLLACVAILLGLGLLLFVLNRSNRRTRNRKAGEASGSQTGESAAGASAVDPLSAGTPFVFDAPEAPLDRSTMRLEEASGEAAEAIPAELPDWLQSAPTIELDPGSTSTMTRDAVPTELPDWLKEQAPAAPEASATAAPASAEEFPDWLQETLPHTPAMPAAQPGAQPAFADEPDWLNETSVIPPAVPTTWEPQETREQTHAKFSGDLAALPAMDAAFASRLRAVGVAVPLLLLKKGATAAGRQKLAEQAGVDPAELDTWVNVVDLFRIRGLTTEHALLLESIGIHGVTELAKADPDALTQAMQTANQEYHLLAQTPVHAETTNWIEQAKKLPLAVA